MRDVFIGITLGILAVAGMIYFWPEKTKNAPEIRHEQTFQTKPVSYSARVYQTSDRCVHIERDAEEVAVFCPDKITIKDVEGLYLAMTTMDLEPPITIALVPWK